MTIATYSNSDIAPTRDKMDPGFGKRERPDGIASAGPLPHDAVRSIVDTQNRSADRALDESKPPRWAKMIEAAAAARRRNACDPEYIKARFLKKIDASGAAPSERPELGPCWIWTANKLPAGYGIFGCYGKTTLAHRYSHETFIGPIPDGYQVDHLCRTPSCVNPAHLEAVTARVNNLRSNSATSRNAAKTHCLNGHPFDEENTRPVPGGRFCRACHRDYMRNQRAELRRQRAEGKSA